MIKKIIFVFLASITVASTAFGIIDGELMKPEHPLIGLGVIIQGYHYKTDDHYCGGVIIAEDTILTAAHCVTEVHHIDSIYFGTTINLNHDHTVKLDVWDYGMGPQKTIAVHPEYLNSLKTDPEWKDIPDLALINFSEFRDSWRYPGLVIDHKYRPIPIAKLDDIPENTEMIVTGPGFTTELYNTNTHFPSVFDMTGAGNMAITTLYSDKKFTDTIFSLKQTKDSSVCYGDSGGGAFVKNKSTDKYELVGIHSYIDGYPNNGQESCRNSKHARYIKVAKYRDWIETTAQKLRELNPPDDSYLPRPMVPSKLNPYLRR